MAWFFPKFTPYMFMIDRKLGQLKETGITNYYFNIFMDPLTEEVGSKSKVAEAKPLSIEQVQGCFFILFVGYGLAFIGFIVEYCRKWTS